MMNNRKTQFRIRFLLLAAIIFLLTTPSPPATGQEHVVAALDPIQGLVQYQAPGASDNSWETLTRVKLVSEGDVIRTDNRGLAYLAFFEGNQAEILPNTQVRVAQFSFVDQDSPEVALAVAVGDMRHQIDHLLDAESRYEVHTPSAIITVRGTDFWTRSTWLSETSVWSLEGRLQVAGVNLQGQLGVPAFVEANQALQVFPLGQLSPVTILDPAQLPQYPPAAPLAPASCGNLVCEANENEANCSLDCQVFSACGNGVCDLNLNEGPVTCPADCVPIFRRTQDGSAEANAVAAQPTAPPPPTAVPQPTATRVPVPCLVSANQPYVNVHVGPGENRSVRFDLPQNQDIPVVGKATDDAGNLWWKIQPPNYNPAEADRYWVKAADVNERGDCDLVTEAAASQIIIPRPTAPPAPKPTSPSLAPYSISFVASRYSIVPGECVTIQWSVEGIREVYYQGNGVTGQGSRVVCPGSTSTYTLTVFLLDGSVVYRSITITVGSVPVW